MLTRLRKFKDIPLSFYPLSKQPYEPHLAAVDFDSLYWQCQRGDLIETLKFLNDYRPAVFAYFEPCRYHLLNLNLQCNFSQIMLLIVDNALPEFVMSARAIGGLLE